MIWWRGCWPNALCEKCSQTEDIDNRINILHGMTDAHIRAWEHSQMKTKTNVHVMMSSFRKRAMAGAWRRIAEQIRLDEKIVFNSNTLHMTPRVLVSKIFFNKYMHLILCCRYRFDSAAIDTEYEAWANQQITFINGCECVYCTKRYKRVIEPCEKCMEWKEDIFLPLLPAIIHKWMKRISIRFAQFFAMKNHQNEQHTYFFSTFCFSYLRFHVDGIFHIWISNGSQTAIICIHTRSKKVVYHIKRKYESHPIIQYMLIN